MILTPEELELVQCAGLVTAAAAERAKGRALLYTRAPSRMEEAKQNRNGVLLHLETKYAHEAIEHAGCILIDGSGKLIDIVELSQGTYDETAAHPREFVRAALSAEASAIVLFHNHPSGDGTPSGQDCRFTVESISLFGALGLHLIDHVVISASGSRSVLGMEAKRSGGKITDTSQYWGKP